MKYMVGGHGECITCMKYIVGGHGEWFLNWIHYRENMRVSLMSHVQEGRMDSGQPSVVDLKMATNLWFTFISEIDSTSCPSKGRWHLVTPFS